MENTTTEPKIVIVNIGTDIAKCNEPDSMCFWDWS